MIEEEMMKEMRSKYFDYLCEKVCAYGVFDGSKAIKHDTPLYLTLLTRLHFNEYEYFPMDTFNWRETAKDQNRYEDGVNLRKKFLCENDLPIEWADKYLYGECTILEMMVALCERSYINYNGGTERLFWHMIKNLGLESCSDENLDFDMIKKIDAAAEVINKRTYDENGVPGLFILPDGCGKDARGMELWSQMLVYTRYLNKIEKEN